MSAKKVLSVAVLSIAVGVLVLVLAGRHTVVGAVGLCFLVLGVVLAANHVGSRLFSHLVD